MPLVAAALAAAFEEEFASDALAATETAGAVRRDFFLKLATALVAYLVANNLVLVTTDDGPGSGSFS